MVLSDVVVLVDKVSWINRGAGKTSRIKMSRVQPFLCSFLFKTDTQDYTLYIKNVFLCVWEFTFCLHFHRCSHMHPERLHLSKCRQPFSARFTLALLTSNASPRGKRWNNSTRRRLPITLLNYFNLKLHGAGTLCIDIH